MAQVTVILQSTLSDWKTTAQAAINANFTEVYAVTDKIDAATAPNPGDVLTWNTGIGQYEPQAPSSGGINDGDTLSTGLTFPNTGLHILDTDASHDLILKHGSNLTADRTLTITTGDSDRTLTLSGNADISGTNTGDQTSVSGNAGTATTLQTSRNINGVSFNGSADIITDIQSQFYTEFGSTICGVHFAGIWPGTGTVNMADQIVYFVAAKILKDVTIDGAYYRLATNGNYTANNNNRIGLYTQSAGTLTLQASCANNGNLWKPGSAGFKSTAFTSGYSATAGETVWFGFLYCRSAQTTAPALSISAGLGTDFDKLDFTNSVRMFCYKTGQTDLPASIAFSTMTAGGGNIFWMVPYT